MMQQMLLGGSGGQLAATITGTTYTRVTNSPASIMFAADGFVYTHSGQVYKWKTGGGYASQYEISSSETSSVFTTDPSNGSYLDLGSDRLWERSAAPGAEETVVATFTIRSKLTGATLATASITLTCNRL